jgi:hypothetical protein
MLLCSKQEVNVLIQHYIKLLRQYATMKKGGPAAGAIKLSLMHLGISILAMHWWIEETNLSGEQSLLSADEFQSKTADSLIGSMSELMDRTFDFNSEMNRIVDAQLKRNPRKLRPVASTFDAAVCLYCSYRDVEDAAMQPLSVVELINRDTFINTSYWRMTMASGETAELFLDKSYIACCTCAAQICSDTQLSFVPYVMAQTGATLPLCARCQKQRLFHAIPQPCPILTTVCVGCLHVSTDTTKQGSPTRQKLRKTPGLARLLCNNCLSNEFLQKQIEVGAICAVAPHVASTSRETLEHNAYVYLKSLLAAEMKGSNSAEAALADAILDQKFQNKK